VLRRAWLGPIAVALALGAASCGGKSAAPSYTITGTTTPLPPGVTSTTRASTLLANTPMSRLVLSGRFKPPAGFSVQSVNPIVPTTGYGYGAVSAKVLSPTAVEYDVTFSPMTVPCETAACTSVSRTLPVGSANPPNAQAIFSPEIGISAECGYDPDGHQVGCDSIVRDEYISVRADSSNVSTADAVAVLKAAVVYVEGLKPEKLKP
jgi:hypothetical protein